MYNNFYPIFIYTNWHSFFDHFNLKTLMSFLGLFSGQRSHTAMVTPTQDESDQSSDSVRTARPEATLTPTAQSNHDILNPAQSNSLPQATDYSPTMGSATVMECPHLQGQQSYAHQYHRFTLPYNAYNSYDYTAEPPTQSNATCNCGFNRYWLVMVILFIVFMLAIIIMIKFVIRPQVPVFRVDTFYISNFHTSNSEFTANWEANVTVKNPSLKLKFSFSEIKILLYYGDDHIGSSSVDSKLYLEPMGHGMLHLKLSTNNTDRRVVDNMIRDRINEGSLSFKMRLVVSATLMDKSWTRDGVIKLLCNNLNVQFVGSASFGILPSGNSRTCLIFSWLRQFFIGLKKEKKKKKRKISFYLFIVPLSSLIFMHQFKSALFWGDLNARHFY